VPLLYCGRQLFSVDGRRGLWCRHRDIDDPDAEMVLASYDRSRSRGRPLTVCLYYMSELSEAVGKLFGTERKERE
jgi:hypothetical protein